MEKSFVKISAVVFDMDGVLFDTEALAKVIWSRMAEVYGIADISAVHRRCIGVNQADGARIFKDAFGEDFPAEEFLRKCERALQKRIKEGGIPLKTGTREILSYLRENKIPVAICSSTDLAIILDHLHDAGLRDYFDIIIGGDMVAHSKPLPDIYLKACEALGFPPSECIAVEDSPNGVRSAHDAGMLTVLVPDQVKPTEAMMTSSFRVEESLFGLLSFLKENL